MTTMDIEALKSQIKTFISAKYNWNNLESSFSRLPKAAVLIALTLNSTNEIQVWLTKRSQSVRNDKGHVCFPGGMYEEQYDKNEIDTALREAHEEIGLVPSSVDVVGTLVPYLSNRKVLITPVIGFVNESFEPEPNSEVEFAFKMPLSRFLKNTNYNKLVFEHPETNASIILHSFDDIVNGEQKVTTFGVTAMILVEVAVAILKMIPEFDQSSYDVNKPMLKQTLFLKSLGETWQKNEMQGKL